MPNVSNLTEFVNAVTGLITVCGGVWLAMRQHRIGKKIDKIDAKITNGNNNK